ncbi:MAG: hypothetical protein PF489_01060 [Salinivirgaceae bacterium]|jgi:hypothetical protein|nr:hypothetical protein [Salinivirgaceae bacterium]
MNYCLLFTRFLYGEGYMVAIVYFGRLSLSGTIINTTVDFGYAFLKVETYFDAL